MTPNVDAIRAQIANPTVLAVSLATAASLCDEIERLRHAVEARLDESHDAMAERDTALAAIDRFTHTVDELRAWRACADQLAAALRFRGAGQNGRESLAVYESLKGGT